MIFYTYLLYPLFLILLTKFFKRKVEQTGNFQEDILIDFVVLAYNEEKVIEEKILNSIKILKNIPGAKLWIVSDGSTDNTNQIVTSFRNNPLVNFIPLKRSGKSQAINSIVNLLHGDIIVFSDANVEYTSETIDNLLQPFYDKKVGCTCGKVIYRNPNNILSGDGESFYWKYENSLKKLESKLGFVAGATGAVYAIRRNLFHFLPKNCINDDFSISMKIVESGFQLKYVEEAIVYENVAPSINSEFKRHIRDATGHYLSIFFLYKLLNPFSGIRSLIFWSHRILRWSVPLFLIILFALNFFLLNKPLYKYLFFAQIIFYFLSILGLLFQKKGKISIILFLPFYFCNLNLALFIGMLNAIFKKNNGKWQSTCR